VTKKVLTEKFIAALKPAPAGKRYLVHDAIVPGLDVRVTDRGHKSYVLGARFPGKLKAARDFCGGDDSAFGRWLADHGCDDLGKDARAALINMGEHPEQTRQALAVTHRRSLRRIWDEEIQPNLGQGDLSPGGERSPAPEEPACSLTADADAAPQPETTAAAAKKPPSARKNTSLRGRHYQKLERLARLEVEVRQLRKQNVAMNSENANLKVENAELKAEVERLRATLADGFKGFVGHG
jgi:hypothetical protein